MSAARPDDIEVFSESIIRYFDVTTRKRASVRSAYLLDSGEPVVWRDYNGLITLNGGFRGSVCFSADRGLLTHVLLTMGESDYSDASHRDIVGEIANTLSGRARRHFGEALDISPPQAFAGRDQAVPALATGRPVAIPIAWNGYEACLVVHMEPRK
jgi:chemotaxis protein CheX